MKRLSGTVGAVAVALGMLMLAAAPGSARGNGEGAAGGGAAEIQVPGSDGAQTGLSTELLPEFQDQEPPAGAPREFSTDFSRATISFDEVMSGGPPKDGIPAIDDPRFVPADEAAEWLGPNESVLVFTTEGDAHIYPIQILMWHEIVNDVVGDRPVAITYCPLCNTGIAFGREHQGETLDFGVSGRLRFSNMLMYDRQSETWWQQATGVGVIGERAGERLEILPLLLLPWRDASVRFADASVLSRETGHNRDYGRNPYTRYDSSQQPFLYRGPEVDDTFEPLSRVIMVEIGTEQRAFPYPVLREDRLAQEEIGGRPVVVLWQDEVASPLDHTLVARGRDVGTANAFLAQADGRTLTFETEGGVIIDEETGSRWDATGKAISGPLEGATLDPVPAVQHFWFSWTAFQPDV